jgi:hypothetical protein
MVLKSKSSWLEYETDVAYVNQYADIFMQVT